MYRAFVHFMWFYLFVACVGDTFLVSNNLILLGEDLCVLIGLGLISCKYLIMFMKSEQLEKITECIKNLTENNHKNDLAKKYYSLRKKYMVFITVVTSSFHFLSMIFFVVFLLSAEDELPLRVYYFVKFNKNLERVVFFFHQFFCLQYGLISIVALDSVCGISWFLIGLELDILGKEFESMVEDYQYLNSKDVQGAINNRMKQLVRRHQHIIL